VSENRPADFGTWLLNAASASPVEVILLRVFEFLRRATAVFAILPGRKGGGSMGLRRTGPHHRARWHAVWLAVALVAASVPFPSTPPTLASQALVLVVNSTGDEGDLSAGDGTCDVGDGICTLRAAIQEANAHEGADVINFDIGEGGSFVIMPGSPLPNIDEQVTIDGTTQPGYDDEVDDPVPLIALDGSGLEVATPGLFVSPTAASTMIRALEIRGFTQDGIQSQADSTLISLNRIHGNAQHGIFLSGSDSSVIADNWIGTQDGTKASPNGGAGVLVGGTGNTLAGNLISGNSQAGVQIIADGNTLLGNRIGTTADGTLALPNGSSGVLVQSSGNTVGGPNRTDGNVISGNGPEASGITISGAASTKNTIEGNYIGTNAAGDAANPNNGTGIRVLSTSDNTIRGNLISGNDGGGVLIAGSTGNVLDSNLIGTDAAGTAALGNDGFGVSIQDSSSNTLITNVISGNVFGGVIVVALSTSTVASGNILMGNYIGTDIGGTFAIPNTGSGVALHGGAQNNVIGGPNEGEPNVISGNFTVGIDISAISGYVTSGNRVQYNLIGLNSTGDGDLGNSLEGVDVSGVGTVVDNLIENNFIAYNRNGVLVRGTATGTRITGNRIFSNDSLGIDLLPSSGEPLGTPTPNDPDDSDSGPNDLQNFPVLSDAGAGSISLFVDGDSSLGGSDYTLELFLVESCDPSGFGEGADRAAFDTLVISDEFGDVTHTFTVTPGIYTATATLNSTGNTSEFSECFTLSAPDLTGDIVVGVRGEPTGLNPFLDPTFALFAIGQAVWTGVFDIDPDTRDLVPEVVTEIPTVANGGVTVNEDGTVTVRYQIREEAVWEDETSISGDDFAFTLEILCSEDLPIRDDLAGDHCLDEESGESDLYIIPDSVKVGPKSFEYTLNRTTLAYRGLFPIILPRHQVEGSDFAADWNDQMWLSGGPYRFVEWVPGDGLVVERNPSYWKQDPVTGEQLPLFDRVVFKFFEDEPSRIQAFRDRLIDVMVSPVSTPLTEVVALRDLGAEVQVIPTSSAVLFYFNFGETRLEENPGSLNEYLKFRRAVAHAIDRQRIADELFGGELPAFDSFLAGVVPAVSQDAWSRYEYDPDLARQLLAELEVELGKDFSEDLPVVHFVYPDHDPLRIQLAEQVLPEMFADVGIDFQIESMSFVDLIGLVFSEDGAWDTTVLGWGLGAGLGNAASALQLWEPNEPFNVGAWGSDGSSVVNEGTARYDAIMDELRSTADPDLATSLIQEAEEILAAQVAVIPLFPFADAAAVWPDRVQGFVNSDGFDTWNIELWRPPSPAPRTSIGFAVSSSVGLEGSTHLVDIVLSVPEGTLSDPVKVTLGEGATGTATSGEDYTLDTIEVTFPAGSGDGTVQQVTLTLVADLVIEPTETVDLQITDVSGPAAVDLGAAAHQVSIFDTSLGEGSSFTAVDPNIDGESEFPIDGPPVFPGLDFIPFSELDPLSAVRAGTGDPVDAEEELAAVGSGIAAIGSGIASIGSGIAAIGSGIAAIGSGIASIGSGIASIGSGIASINIQFIGSGIAAIGSGIASIDPPLSTIPITVEGDSWEERLVGTIFEGAPLQSITLSQVATGAPSALADLTLGGVDYSSSAFGSLSLASVTVGNLTVGQVLNTTENSICDLVFGSDPPSDSCGQTVIEADVAGADMRSIGSGIASIEIADVDLSAQPIGTTTIGAIGSGIAAIDLVFDCDVVDCSPTSTVTLAEAQNASAIKLTLLGELYLLLLPPSSYDWTQMPVDLLQVDVGPLARYDLVFVRKDTSVADSTVDITLPTGVHYEPGTVLLTASDGFGNPLPAPPLGEPTITGQDLQWIFQTTPGVRYQLSFLGRINIMPLGVHRASASVTTGEDPALSAADSAPITVTENFEPNNSPETAEPIDDTGLYVSYLPRSVDEDYFSFAIPEGRVAKVLLHHLDDDFDLLYYEPTSVTPASSRTVSGFGPTTPPLDDEGRQTDDGPLDPEAADDLDLQAIGSGIAAIGSGIAAIGSNRGTDGEEVEGSSGGTTGTESGIRVAGYNGASSDQPYLLQLKFVQPIDAVCPPFPIEFSTITPGSLPTVPGNADTLILWNAQRTEAIYGTQARGDLESALDELAQTLRGLGQVPVVIPVDGSPTVLAAYDAWDDNPCSASGANGVVAAINDLVDSFGLAPPQLTSITLIGADVLVPYERRIDLTDIANQREYASALRNTVSAQQTGEFGAALGGYVLSNDAYAAFTSIYDWLGHTLYLPDVGIGRLVETPDEILFSIAQFINAGGVLNPATAVTDLDALVTGYDFLSDGSFAQADALDADFGTGATDRSLVNDIWTSNNFSAALSALPNVLGLGAHFDHQRFLPASVGVDSTGTADAINYETSDLLAESFASSLAGRVFFSVGCNAGATVPDFITTAGDYSLPGGGSTLDWAQAFSRLGAVFVGNTAFGYGLDDSVGLSEKLMERFSVRLDGTYFIGDALASSKQEHFAQNLVYGPYDEKVIAESTLYGFPFWRLTDDTPTGDTPPGPPPGSPQQLSFTHTLVSTDNGSFYTTDGNATQLFHRPIQPQEFFQYLTTDGSRATGVMIRGLTSRDETPFDPAFARPIVDLAGREPELETPGTIFPNVFASTNSRETPAGIVSTVVLATGQFIGEGAGVQRLFTGMEVEVLFGSTAGSAPEVVLADAQLSNPTITFTVVVDGPADEVLVLYKPAGVDAGETTWDAQALTEISGGVWTATVEGVSDQIEWFAQVRNGSFVSTSFNKGLLFAARLVDAGDDATVVEGDTYTLTGSFLDPEELGPYTATVDWGDGTPVTTVSSFSTIPDSTALGVSADHVYTDDGSYPVEVCVTPLGEGIECDALTVTVVNADPTFESVDLSSSGGVVNLAVAFADPGDDDTHTATVDWGDGTVEPVLVDPATRTLFASHGFDTTDPGTITVTLVDDDGGTAVVEIVEGNMAPVVGPVSGPADPVAVDTSVSILAGFADFDATGGYTVTIDWGDDTTTTSGTGDISVTFDDATRTGTVTGDHVYTEPGVYAVTVTVTDGLGASGSDVFEPVVVYDPDASFIIGGGWIFSSEGAYHPDPSLTGKAQFGFVSRYKRGASVPSGAIQFRFTAAGLSFFSDEYEWLVISGSRARYQGVGEVNGEPGFKFLITAFDANLNTNDSFERDRFRIKIWWEDESGERVVYDNGCFLEQSTGTTTCEENFPEEETKGTTEIGGGAIRIQKKR
jgi:CSLREA domain-containing protein